MKKKDKTITYELTINVSLIKQWLLLLGVCGLYIVMFVFLFKYHGIM